MSDLATYLYIVFKTYVWTHIVVIIFCFIMFIGASFINWEIYDVASEINEQLNDLREFRIFEMLMGFFSFFVGLFIYLDL